VTGDTLFIVQRRAGARLILRDAALQDTEPSWRLARLTHVVAQDARRRTGRKDTAMISISHSMLLAAGLLAFPVAGAMAQQNSNGGGAALKSTTPGNAGNASSSANTSGGSTLKTTTLGDTGKKVTPDSHGDSSLNGASTGPSAKQPQ